jgi:hypothetical protein
MAICATRADNEDLLYQCASSMVNRAKHAHNKVELVHIGVQRCIVALRKESSQAVQIEVVQAFLLLSYVSENSVGVLDKKVLFNVIDLLNYCEEETCTDSAATINNLVNLET